MATINEPQSNVNVDDTVICSVFCEECNDVRMVMELHIECVRAVTDGRSPCSECVLLHAVAVAEHHGPFVVLDYDATSYWLFDVVFDAPAERNCCCLRRYAPSNADQLVGDGCVESHPGHMRGRGGRGGRCRGRGRGQRAGGGHNVQRRWQPVRRAELDHGRCRGGRCHLPNHHEHYCGGRGGWVDGIGRVGVDLEEPVEPLVMIPARRPAGGLELVPHEPEPPEDDPPEVVVEIDTVRRRMMAHQALDPETSEFKFPVSDEPPLRGATWQFEQLLRRGLMRRSEVVLGHLGTVGFSPLERDLFDQLYHETRGRVTHSLTVQTAERDLMNCTSVLFCGRLTLDPVRVRRFNQPMVLSANSGGPCGVSLGLPWEKRGIDLVVMVDGVEETVHHNDWVHTAISDPGVRYHRISAHGGVYLTVIRDADVEDRVEGHKPSSRFVEYPPRLRRTHSLWVDTVLARKHIKRAMAKRSQVQDTVLFADLVIDMKASETHVALRKLSTWKDPFGRVLQDTFEYVNSTAKLSIWDVMNRSKYATSSESNIRRFLTVGYDYYDNRIVAFLAATVFVIHLLCLISGFRVIDQFVAVMISVAILFSNRDRWKARAPVMLYFHVVCLVWLYFSETIPAQVVRALIAEVSHVQLPFYSAAPAVNQNLLLFFLPLLLLLWFLIDGMEAPNPATEHLELYNQGLYSVAREVVGVHVGIDREAYLPANAVIKPAEKDPFVSMKIRVNGHVTKTLPVPAREKSQTIFLAHSGMLVPPIKHIATAVDALKGRNLVKVPDGDPELYMQAVDAMTMEWPAEAISPLSRQEVVDGIKIGWKKKKMEKALRELNDGVGHCFDPFSKYANDRKFPRLLGGFAKWNETLPEAVVDGVEGVRPRMITSVATDVMLELQREVLPAAKLLKQRWEEPFSYQGQKWHFTYASGMLDLDLTDWRVAALDRLGSDCFSAVMMGDDSVVVWRDNAGGAMISEMDYSKFDNSQKDPQIKAELEVYRRLGMSKSVVSLLAAVYSKPQRLRQFRNGLRLEVLFDPGSNLIEGKEQPRMRRVTGAPTTSMGNTIVNGLAILLASGSAFQDWTSTGLVCKVRINHPEFNSDPTFLRGAWQLLEDGSRFWMPLPSQICKLCKVQKIGMNELHYRRLMHGMASSYASVPDNFPVFGSFLRCLRRNGREGMEVPMEDHKIQLTTHRALDRPAAISWFMRRYCVTEEQICEVESIFNTVKLPAFVGHELLKKLAGDYL